MAPFILLTTVLASLASGTLAQTWCGKNYKFTSPIVSPGGKFPIPSTSTSPRLAFRCAPAIRPYLPEDASASQSFIIDTPVTYSSISGSSPLTLPSSNASTTSLAVTISLNGKTLASGNVPLNATKAELSFSLASLTAQTKSYNVTCTASYTAVAGKTQSFTASTALSYLPTPPSGRSVTKTDLRSGALLARPANGSPGAYQPVFPIGYYTSFGDYLAKNLSVIDDIKARGFTLIHPVPSFDNITALNAVLDRMQQVGLYLMYDMRWTYMNTTAVETEVNRVKNRPNLLLWYTGDEPDGTSDPLDATLKTYNQIYSLDGYHPVSLVLNCENYYFNEYSTGSDIVMQDAYMIGNNVTWSTVWNTPCTPDYGDCGCDNCKGAFEDISDRMDEFAERLFVNGWDRSKSMWTVPQAFGPETYWKRVPTGKEYVVQSILGINHGGKGVVAWDDPTTADIKSYSSILAQSLGIMKQYILDPYAKFQGIVSGRVDVGVWSVGTKKLVLATNMNYAQAKFDLGTVPGANTAKVVQVLDTGASLSGSVVILESVGSGAFILG